MKKVSQTIVLSICKTSNAWRAKLFPPSPMQTKAPTTMGATINNVMPTIRLIKGKSPFATNV
ncbi:MAG: hypothetical protein WBI53_11025 [Paludibacter sp.]